MRTTIIIAFLLTIFSYNSYAQRVVVFEEPGTDLTTFGYLPSHVGNMYFGDAYSKAHDQFLGGMLLTGFGSFGVFFSGYSIIASEHMSKGPGGDFFKTESWMIITGVVGAGCVGIGIPLLLKGKRQLRLYTDEYNMRYYRQGYGYAPSLNFGPTKSGVGLSFNF